MIVQIKLVLQPFRYNIAWSLRPRRHLVSLELKSLGIWNLFCGIFCIKHNIYYKMLNFLFKKLIDNWGRDSILEYKDLTNMRSCDKLEREINILIGIRVWFQCSIEYLRFCFVSIWHLDQLTTCDLMNIWHVYSNKTKHEYLIRTQKKKNWRKKKSNSIQPKINPNDTRPIKWNH